jgi:hypothetical protein
MPFTKYGLTWNDGVSPLEIEFELIRKNGHIMQHGRQGGEGLLAHFLAARKLIWPERWFNRWTELIYKEIIEHEITILMGAASTSKTATASEWLLIDYWTHPENTLALVTTTTVDKLESNIFGETKSLWSKGRERWPWLAGKLVDHLHSIFTDDIENDNVRDRRKGIVGKACYEGKQYVGDAIFVGIKQQRVRFIGDEAQWMASSWLRAWNSLFANPDVKVVASGNPNHNPDDPLGVSAEPKGGWNSLPEPDVTTCWDTKWLNGRCVNLVGTDSPNFDVGPEAIEPYPGLIGYKFKRRVEHDSGPDSPDFYRRVKGVMKFSLAHDRVITKQLCRDHRVFEKAVWASEKRVKIYAVDPAYGGGDRCMRGWAEFGEDIDGDQIIRFTPPAPIQINLRLKASPEDQIAEAVKIDLDQYDIPYENAFYGAFGKGTVGYAFSRVFGHNPPLPIEEGGNPTRRPVRQDLRIFDERTRQLRLKRCDEHYSKKITELWFSMRYAIEAEQVRELTEDVVDEGCIREYKNVGGNKIEVEPKEDLKERLGRSPDKFDWATFILEGARQRGFVIASLGPEEEGESVRDDWLRDLVDKQMKLVRNHQVVVGR